jgi:hypothetical protein
VNASRWLDLRLILVVAFVLAGVWAATAFAGGSDRASGSTGAGDGPGAVFAQQPPDGGSQPPGVDCPNRGGPGNDGSGVGSPDV